MQGTGYVYEVLLRPYVAKHETDIDRKLLELRARVWDLAIFYWQHCAKFGQTTFVQMLQFLAAQSARMPSHGGSEVESKFPPKYIFEVNCSGFGVEPNSFYPLFHPSGNV